MSAAPRNLKVSIFGQLTDHWANMGLYACERFCR